MLSRLQPHWLSDLAPYTFPGGITFNVCLVAAFLMLFQVNLVAGSSSESVISQLERARADLRISKDTEARIKSEIARLRQSGNASAAMLRHYETYLQRVQAMRQELQQLVQTLESMLVKLESAHASTYPASSSRGTTGVEVKLPEEKAFDKVAALDRELDASLAAFDAMLLKEVEKIRIRSAQRMRGLAEGAATAAKEARGQREEASEASVPGASETSVPEAAARTGEATKPAGTQEAKVDPDGSSEQGSAQTRPASRPTESEDDDIVARQLREAAEQETDPVLKEKLWKEYEDYKQGRRR